MKTDQFREQYLRESVPAYYNGWVHFAFTSSVCIAGIIFFSFRVDAPSTLEWLVIPLTALYANLVEYVGHRWPMHHSYRGLSLIYQRHALEHHQFYTDEKMVYRNHRDFKMVLFPAAAILFFFGIFAVPVSLILGFWVSPNTGNLFAVVALIYFLNYEWLHMAYHAPESSWIYRIPGMKHLRRLHTDHHNLTLMSRHNFNITYPIGDLVFGTYYSKKTGDRR